MPIFLRLSISQKRLAIVKNVVFYLGWQGYLVLEQLNHLAKVVGVAIDENDITSLLLHQQ